MKGIFVSDINKEMDVKDFFLVVKKGIYSSRNNTKYASVKLKDKTGSIDARIWDRVDELARRIRAQRHSLRGIEGAGCIKSRCSST